MKNAFAILLFFMSHSCMAQHPCLSLTPNGVEQIQQNLGKVPIFDKQLAAAIQEIDEILKSTVDIPIPKDMAGAYTHEQHKKNYKLMYKAGNLYQITGNDKYAAFVKSMLIRYAEMYVDLPLHPTNRSYATGKIFWQCLNDANWLVFTSQAYDCIYNYLSEKERQNLEENLFIPFANFLSIDNPRFFNRIHNHSTWANAAVGMIALVMDNDSLIQKSLYGLHNDGINTTEVDNDGGFIKKEGVAKAGFLAQLDYSFSPDGYFAEGPYYLRYAIFPFLKFSHALHNKKPELNIFEYNNSILKKATNALLQLTDAKGFFFPINDAQKGMTYTAYELVYAVNLMYFFDNEQKDLLDWAALQQYVSLDEAGFAIAKDLENHKMKTPEKLSGFFRDGENGDKGGVAVLRSDDVEVLFKFSTQGMGHGHFDRLSYSMFQSGDEVVQDYGAVRWVNIDQKAGGRYLPENKTFGKQTIGHNALVVNETSHYEGTVKKAEKTHPELYYKDFSKDNIQLISAKENNAYPNTEMHRTLALIKDEDLNGTLTLDLMRYSGVDNTLLDLPLWFVGHPMNNNENCTKLLDQLKPLGTQNGYQHIWNQSQCKAESNLFQFNWLGHDRFYTMHCVTDSSDEVIIGMAGANDPNFNLRNDPVLIHRKKGTTTTTYANILEAHGNYNRITEIPDQPYTQILDFVIEYESSEYIAVSFSTEEFIWDFYICVANNNANKAHEVNFGNKQHSWQGVYKFIKTKK